MTWGNESSSDHDDHHQQRDNINRLIINRHNTVVDNIATTTDHDHDHHDLITESKFESNSTTTSNTAHELKTITCPSCGHQIEFQDQQAGIQDLPGLPAGVKFDPTDQEILEHLEAKVLLDSRKLHPLIDEFIPTLEGENGICYTHPERLPGVSKDGQIRHFFHRPSKAYTTGTRKRRKVNTDEDGSETRWHKTGKTRPVFVGRGGVVKGFKKILVLYTNYGRQRKPEKTNWVMHQYHLGHNEEEKDGELVVSKVFYQTQPRQCGSTNLIKDISFETTTTNNNNNINLRYNNSGILVDNTPSTLHLPKKPNLHHHDHVHVEYYNPNSFLNYDDHQEGSHIINNRESPPQLIPNFVVQGDGSSFIHRLTSEATKGKLIERKI